ncbi:hypothetical protein G7046_g5074 [Stylonectria norvegica]|nr:hypothetical protein G7046_g5074 [Stylonectria norvegica]
MSSKASPPAERLARKREIHGSRLAETRALRDHLRSAEDMPSQVNASTANRQNAESALKADLQTVETTHLRGCTGENGAAPTPRGTQELQDLIRLRGANNEEEHDEIHGMGT